MTAGGFSVFVQGCALIGALCAGFILSQSARRRSNQLVAALVFGASWWALANANVDGSADAERALTWMRLGVPGWAFIGGLLPHISLRYFDSYPRHELVGARRMAGAAALVGYLAGAVVLLAAITRPDWLFREVHAVAWGWNHEPAPLQLAYFAVAVPCAMVVFPMAYLGFRCSVAVAPLAQRLSIYVAMSIPATMIGVTEMALPIARIDFPRLGAASYSLFGIIFVVAVLRYGLTFLTPNLFSDEILDALEEGVALITPAGRIRNINRNLAEITGWTSDDLIGQPAETLFGDDTPVCEGVSDASGELRTHRSEPIPIALSAASLKDQQGNDMGLVVAVRDMREIQAMRRQMVTQARLAAVGELAAGVAHEINNPLAFVRSNLGLLESYVKSLAHGPARMQAGDASLDEIERDAIDAIRESIEGVDRVTSVVQGVRRFTDSAGQAPRETAALNALIEDAIAMARLQDRSGRVVIDFTPGDVPEISCGARDVRQAVLNLLVNGLEATSGGGRLRVATFAETEHVVAEIEDEGCGMSADAAARAFDPFYTTKKSGDGTGLGLTIAWHILDAHGGTIDIESAPGRGTTVRARLPR